MFTQVMVQFTVITFEYCSLQDMHYVCYANYTLYVAQIKILLRHINARICKLVIF